MTIAFLVALAAVNTAYLVFLDRQGAREREERAMLLQRIQAPQAAVHEHHAALSPPDPESSPLPMSDEEIAELQSQMVPDGASEFARMVAQMEAAENGTGQIRDGILP